MSVSLSDIDRVYLNNKAMATIVKSISNPPLTLWATFVPCFYIDVMLFDFFMIFLDIEKNLILIQYAMFSSRFMLFPLKQEASRPDSSAV